MIRLLLFVIGIYELVSRLNKKSRSDPDPVLSWRVVENDFGDRDVLPCEEEDDHSRGPGCICGPKIDLVGSVIVTVHNSFDHREIVEEALAIILEGKES